MQKLLSIILLSFCILQSAYARKEVVDDINDLPLDTLLSVKVDSLEIDSTTIEAPEEVYDKFYYIPRTSTIHIPMSINIPLIERRLNEAFSGLIYNDSIIDDDGLELKAWKTRNIKLKYQADTLFYTIPVKIWAEKRFDLGITTTDKELNAEIEIDFQTTINFSKDWKLLTHTTILDYRWLSKPTIKILGMNMSISFLADQLIASNRNDFNKEIDKALNEQIPLADYMAEIWTSMQEPISTNASGYQIWIVASPENIYCTPLLGDLGKLTTTLGIKTKLDLFVGNQNPGSRRKTKLPPLKMYSNCMDTIDIGVLTDLPYELMDSVAMDLLKGTTFGEGRHSISVDTIFFYGKKDKLVIGLGVSGFINGKIYLESVPYFDKENVSIKVTDVDYKLDTRNVLAKIVNLFYKKKLKEKLENEFELPLRTEFEMIKEFGRNSIFDTEIFPDIKINGRLDDIGVERIQITPIGLKVSLDINGKLRLSVD